MVCHCVRSINLKYEEAIDRFGQQCEEKKNYIYTECNRRNGPDFGRVFLRSNYTDITQNTYIQSSMVTEIMAGEI